MRPLLMLVWFHIDACLVPPHRAFGDARPIGFTLTILDGEADQNHYF